MRRALLALGLASCAAAAESAPPPQAESPVPALLAEGRRLLEEGRHELALERFERAADLDGPSARVWLARAWIAVGREEDALAAADELTELGAAPAELDYLYGLAFHAAAMREAAAGGGAYTQGAFEDAVRFLSSAVAADPALFGDAYLPLAEAAWYAADLETAADAAQRAVERRPSDAAALLLRGRVSFSRFSAARSAGDEAAAEALWEETRAAFEAVEAADPEPAGERGRLLLAQAFEQLADLHLWREEAEPAARALEQALAWDPRVVDFNRARESLGGARFESLLSGAREEFAERHAGEAEPPGAALLAWWAGFAAFREGKLPEAEQRFQEAVELEPDYVNSWYYLFRTAYGQRAYERSLIALRAHAAQDRQELLGLLAGESELNLRILEFLVTWLIDPEQQAEERYREAALLSELLTELRPEEPRYWNNLGLFLRDHGDQLKLKLPPPDPAELAPLWEQAYAAYRRTLELAPDHPAYLNDSAVMLHYYLERDLDQAESMYLRAIERAEEELARESLPPADRTWFETVRTDAADNLDKLRAARAPKG